MSELADVDVEVARGVDGGADKKTSKSPLPVEVNVVELSYDGPAAIENEGCSYANVHVKRAVAEDEGPAAAARQDSEALVEQSQKDSGDGDNVGGGSASQSQSQRTMDDDGGLAAATSQHQQSRHASARRLCGSTASSSDSETADDAPLLPELPTSVPVRIDIPGEDKPASPHDRFPKRRMRTVVSFLMLVCAAILNDIVLSFVHEKMPDTPPLPDIVFDAIPYYKPGLAICEWLMLASFSSVLLLMLFHRHRWIMARRLFSTGAILYLMRCVTMIVTQVPKADANWYCSPKLGENATFWNVVLRGVKLVAGVGLNVAGENTLCGDYIYSGHTIVLVVSALFIGEYSPRRWRWLHVASWVVAAVAVVFLVISHGHYTLDVILSYFICTRVFWLYHTMAAHPTLRSSAHNHHRKEFWYPLFGWLEADIQRPVPRRFQPPFRLNSLFSWTSGRRRNSARTAIE